MEKNENKGIFSRIYDWFAGLTIRGLLGAILVAFIIIIILLSLSQLPGIMSRISSSLSAALYSIFIPAENATITTDKKIVTTGEDFTVTFKKGDEPTLGLFAISYNCNNNAELFSIENSGLKKISCETRYYLLENDTTIKIRANTKENVVRLVIEGTFENNETQKIDTVGVVRVTVKNDTLGTVVTSPAVTPSVATSTTPAVTTTPAPYVPSLPAPVQPTYYGTSDLAIRLLQVGLLNNGTNLISPRSQFSYNDMVGIKFEVRNDGETNTGPWTFTAVLPSLSTPTYNSNTQISLRPGESIIFTLGFSNLANKNVNTININVDPQNLVKENVEYNNILTTTITNLSAGNNSYYNNNNYYNNNYNYNTGCYVNGIFTYNCLNNTGGYYDQYGNWINYNYNNYNDLTVSCYAEPDNPETGERVRWYAEADGGDGDYDYDWTGTNGLDSSSRNPTKTYSSRGWKYATVTVESDGYSVSRTCSVYVD